jgi:hypothetical protein
MDEDGKKVWKDRSDMCGNCEHSLNTHEENEIHEVCEAGVCMYCFWSKKCDCDCFKERKGE